MVDLLQTARLLGRHEVRRAEDGARLGARGEAGHAIGRAHLGDAEVEDLGDLLVVVFVTDEEHVLRLEIAVGDAELVSLAETATDLDEDLGRLVEREAPHALDALVERLSLEQLHDDVRAEVVGGAVVVDLDGVLAAQGGRGTRLVVEALARLHALGVARVDELDGDARAQARMLRFPHRAHAALADLAHEPVLPCHQGARRGSGVDHGARFRGSVTCRPLLVQVSSVYSQAMPAASPAPSPGTSTVANPALPPPGADGHLFLIDLSGYIFRAYHAIAPLSNSKGEVTHAVMGTVNMLQKVVNERRPHRLAVAMDSRKASFRRELDARYKANRPPPPADLSAQIERCRQVVEAYNIPIFQVDGLEADDLIAVAVDRALADGLSVVVVSSDKDLMQLVHDDDARVVLWDSMRDKVYGPREVEAKFGVPPSKLRDLLALTGDSSDNVPGVPSVGPKTAARSARAVRRSRRDLRSSGRGEAAEAAGRAAGARGGRAHVAHAGDPEAGTSRSPGTWRTWCTAARITWSCGDSSESWSSPVCATWSIKTRSGNRPTSLARWR